MSTLYNLEPQPTAKVVLQTTTGDLSFELFAKQTPLASRNFLQHCIDGYYNGTIFHRLVSGFIIQGGDPTGTGAGGESAINNGEPFADEFHSRLKFNRRGLLGMANEGKDSNGSQFFITLAATPELQGKHTMFGRVEGDTIYNVMKMAEAEMAEGEGNERPLYPTKITGAEILVNPFEDMVARVKEAPRTKEEPRAKEVKKRKKPAGKNVLSFGVDEGEEDVAAPVLKKAKANPKLVNVPADEADDELREQKIQKPAKRDTRKKERSQTPPESSNDPHEHSPKARAPTIPARTVPPPASPSPSPEPDEKPNSSALERTNAEIAALKASMKRNSETTASGKVEQPKSTLEAMIPSKSTRGRKRGKASDEKGALDIFKAFKQRLEDLPPEQKKANEETPKTNGHVNNKPNDSTSPTNEAADAVDEEAELCDLHFIANCQSCKSWDADKPDGEAEANGGGDDDGGWMSHSLSFAKDTLGKDLEWKKKMEELVVIDPREKAKSIQEEKRKGKGKERAVR